MVKQASTKKKYAPFAAIRHLNSPNAATTIDGIPVTRQEAIILSTWGYPINCAQYDNHFIYDDPAARNTKGRWTPMCTCGSFAGVFGYEAYRRDASRQGELIVCWHHASFNKHADGSG